MSSSRLSSDPKAYNWRLHRNVLLYTLGVVCLFGTMAIAEKKGLSRSWIGPIFLFSTVMLYAVIGIYGRTTDPDEYYVAGRRIPAMYNGMATAADWMSAASFISLSGALYLQGYSGTSSQPGGLAYIMGWTGGFCLLGLLIAPHLRRMRLYTLPDFFQVRYGGKWPRILAALAAILCSFTYVVAQIYGVGLIASRLTGVQFEIGILLGLGGVLLCSFLGGMRAITWTQVAQYIVMMLAFLIPVSWLAYKQIGTAWAPMAYGSQISKITHLEQEILHSPEEIAVRDAYLRQATFDEMRLQSIGLSLRQERAKLEDHLNELKSHGADLQLVVQTRRELNRLPKDEHAARDQWARSAQDLLERSKPLGGAVLHAQTFAGQPEGTAAEQDDFEVSRRNFLALVFCLMVGTAAMPHLLTRFYTCATVAETRNSVAWSLFFIVILYVCMPALAVMVKFEVMHNLVGISFAELPHWMVQWARVDPGLIAVQDVNGDGFLQFAEIRIGADMIMLATPELGGLPYVVSGMVAAGGLAAALSTADGLLLTITNAVVKDMRGTAKDDVYSLEKRVIFSKFVLLFVAMVAALAAATRTAEILALVTTSFSLAASAFFPAMVMGIYWRRASQMGAVMGMVCGFMLTAGYMLFNLAWVRNALDLEPGAGMWWDIQPISAGVFGVSLGFITIAVFSFLFPDRALDRHHVSRKSTV
jgi:cation/acetate symporter